MDEKGEVDSYSSTDVIRQLLAVADQHKHAGADDNKYSVVFDACGKTHFIPANWRGNFDLKDILYC